MNVTLGAANRIGSYWTKQVLFVKPVFVTGCYAGYLLSLRASCRVATTSVHTLRFFMKRWQANVLLTLAGAVWGMGFVAQATAMKSVGPFLFIGLRFLVASTVLVPWVVAEHRRNRPYHQASSAATLLLSDIDNINHRVNSGNAPLVRSDWLKFALIGVMLFAGMATQQVGLLSTSVTNSGFLTGLYVVFTPLLAVLLFRDLPHPVTWLSALLALLGIYLLSGGNLAKLVVGDLLTIGSAIFWSMQVVMIARFVVQSGRPMALSIMQFAVTAVLALMMALVFEPIVWSGIVAAGPQILYAGIFASGLAFTLQVVGQRYTSAAQAAIFLSSEAPFAALFAYLLLDERITLVGLAGCGLILLAMLSVELVPQWLAKRSARIRPTGAGF